MVVIYNASNNAQSTLSATINSAVTSLTVADASSFPAVPFVITIENEILEVTNKVGNVLTVVRGHESTTPAGHLAGVSVEHRWTAGMHTELAGEISDNASDLSNHILEAALKHIHSSGTGFIKLDDGTMLCYGVGTITDFINGTNDFSLPQTFISAESMSLLVSIRSIATGSSTASYVTECGVLTTSSIRLKALVHTASTVTPPSASVGCSYLVVGRWK